MYASGAISPVPVSDSASLSELFKSLLQFAILAPSEHNSQPWLFRIDRDSIELFADRTRALPVVDPHDRALTMACGAALDHLVLAARNDGWNAVVELCPDAADDDLLARVTLNDAYSPSPDEKAMFAAISKRRTTRTNFQRKTLPEDVRRQCLEFAKQFGVELTLITSHSGRSEIARLVTNADRAQLADPRFRRELASWIHSRRVATGDGMARPELGVPDVLSPVGTLVIRSFDLGNGHAPRDAEEICLGSPTLAIFSSPGDSVIHWLATGRALSRVLLSLTAAGVSASFLNPPVEVRELRPRLRGLAHCRGVPQLLMRFGYGPPVKATMRRPIDEVLIA